MGFWLALISTKGCFKVEEGEGYWGWGLVSVPQRWY